MFENIMTAVQETQNTGTSSFETLCWIVATVGMWKMFEKAGEPGWPSIIPFYRSYKLCEICMGDPWYWLRLFVIIIPVVGWAMAIYFAYQMYKAVSLSYGKPETYAWGFIFLAPVFYCMLGFGEASYYGPNGAGDTRNRQAKESKTVNFEVIKDEPAPARTAEQSRPAASPVQEEDIDFNFDQPEE